MFHLKLIQYVFKIIYKYIAFTIRKLSEALWVSKYSMTWCNKENRIPRKTRLILYYENFQYVKKNLRRRLEKYICILKEVVSKTQKTNVVFAN